jgi:hypothetical protein
MSRLKKYFRPLELAAANGAIAIPLLLHVSVAFGTVPLWNGTYLKLRTAQSAEIQPLPMMLALYSCLVTVNMVIISVATHTFNLLN